MCKKTRRKDENKKFLEKENINLGLEVKLAHFSTQNSHRFLMCSNNNRELLELVPLHLDW